MTLILYFERRFGKSTAGQMMDACLVLMVLRKRELWVFKGGKNGKILM